MRIPAALAVFLACSSAAFAQDQQVGARTKGMGGSYTAFEDDPVSVWLNPAGIAGQTDSMALAYQTFTSWEIEINSSLIGGADPRIAPVQSWNDPALIPSFLGVVFQAGTPESPQAFGFCFTSPFRLDWPMSTIGDNDVPGAEFTQVFYRFRGSYARDFRLRPAGEEGAFTHLAIGVGLDVGVSRVNFRELAAESFPGFPLEFDVTDTGVGGGAGLLLGVYDNTRNFKVNLGAAYQSKIEYKFSASKTFMTSFDWPNQYQAGLTTYLFEGMPLRATFDVQYIDWDGASEDSSVATMPDFQSVTNYSVGLEYRLPFRPMGEKVSLYPRLGFRRYDAPWESDHRQKQPGIGNRRIVVDPKEDVYEILTVGLGVGWSSEQNRLRTFDLAMDFGGDVAGLAMGFSMEF
jgi:hypothetical protein